MSCLWCRLVSCLVGLDVAALSGALSAVLGEMFWGRGILDFAVFWAELPGLRLEARNDTQDGVEPDHDRAAPEASEARDGGVADSEGSTQPHECTSR